MDCYIWRTTSFQQRLGLILALVLQTSRLRTTDSEKLAGTLLNILTKKQAYWTRPEKKLCDEERRRLREVEPDWTDWTVAGHTRLTDMTQTLDIVSWAQDLEILDPKNRWRSMGHIASKLIEEYQTNAFKGEGLVPNPLQLSFPQRIFFLFVLLRRDGLFLVPFLKKLTTQTISRKVSVQAFMETWHEVAEKIDSRQLRKDIDGLNASLDTHSSAELRVKAKLEPLVDLDLLQRTDPWEFEYIMTEKGRRIANSKYLFPDRGAISADELDRLLEQDFYKLAFETYLAPGGEPISHPQGLDDLVLGGYGKLTGGLGLTRIDEICILGGLIAISGTPPRVAEISQLRQRIFSLNKEDRLRYSLYVDMHGNAAYLKLGKTLLSDNREHGD